MDSIMIGQRDAELRALGRSGDEIHTTAVLRGATTEIRESHPFDGGGWIEAASIVVNGDGELRAALHEADVHCRRGGLMR